MPKREANERQAGAACRRQAAENEDGQLGRGTTGGGDWPADVLGLTAGVASVEAGADHTCAVTTTGEVKCWGDDEDGQLGDGSPGARTAPVSVGGASAPAVAVAAGFGHTCALTTAGEVKCWGDDYLRRQP